MNILIPHQWLLEHLTTKATVRELQELLSQAGPSVERVTKVEGDHVFDIEITTNRIDAFSVRGIAREAAVILRQNGIPAKLKPLVLKPALPPRSTLPLPSIMSDVKLNRRTMCVVLDEVKRLPTPIWMAQKLRQVDHTVHDAVVDITNYVMHELGYPSHAFDYDKIMKRGGVIKINQAKPGETFVTLDQQTCTCVGGEVVFRDKKGQIIDLPGIKGTANTSIDDQTQRVLLLIESIQPKLIRFASMTHAIRSTAAQINEKGPDPYLIPQAIQRGIELYQSVCQAKVASRVFDDFPKPPKPTPIHLTNAEIEAYLGLRLPGNTVRQILSGLECAVSVLSNGSYRVVPPTFRPDLESAVDLIEELARLYGYHRLPNALMSGALPLKRPTETNFQLEQKIADFLAASGWQEVYTYSLVSAELAEQSGYALKDHLKLRNPLSEDQVYLRRSLIPSLLQILTNHPTEKKLSVFELASLYIPQDKDLPMQPRVLTLVAHQTPRQLRGTLEALAGWLLITGLTFSQTDAQQATITAYQTSTRKKINLGKLRVIDAQTIGVELELTGIMNVARSHPSYQPLPKAAPVIEDMTFFIPGSIRVGDVMQIMQQTDSLIQNITLEKIYQQNYTFRLIYQHQTLTLSNQDIKPIRQKLLTAVTSLHGVRLIGAA